MPSPSRQPCASAAAVSSWAVSDRVTYSPFSPAAAPSTRNRRAMVVLPVPGLPSSRNTRPVARPPSRMSSSPGTPVRALETAPPIVVAPSPHCPLLGPARRAELPAARSVKRRGIGQVPDRYCLADVALDDVQEGRAIALELGVANAVNLTEGARAGGAMGGELGQGPVGEHDVGRHLLLLGEPGAQRL